MSADSWMQILVGFQVSADESMCTYSRLQGDSLQYRLHTVQPYVRVLQLYTDYSTCDMVLLSHRDGGAHRPLLNIVFTLKLYRPHASKAKGRKLRDLLGF